MGRQQGKGNRKPRTQYSRLHSAVHSPPRAEGGWGSVARSSARLASLSLRSFTLGPRVIPLCAHDAAALCYARGLACAIAQKWVGNGLYKHNLNYPLKMVCKLAVSTLRKLSPPVLSDKTLSVLSRPSLSEGARVSSLSSNSSAFVYATGRSIGGNGETGAEGGEMEPDKTSEELALTAKGRNARGQGSGDSAPLLHRLGILGRG